MMNNELIGSHLTRLLLKQQERPIWCSVSDNSDEEAMQDLIGHDFTLFINSYKEGKFYCTGGMQWSFAVPIKIVAATQN